MFIECNLNVNVFGIHFIYDTMIMMSMLLVLCMVVVIDIISWISLRDFMVPF